MILLIPEKAKTTATAKPDLNSIMILLIPEKAKTTATAKPDLNSIMILLIQVCFF